VNILKQQELCNIIQIVTGIEVNSESNIAQVPKARGQYSRN